MSMESSKLNELSMVAANFGDGIILEDILHDWLGFLGGKPGEIVIVDGGSNKETQDVYWRLFQNCLIDKLQIIQPNHEENDKGKCFVQEYTAGAISSKPYILFFKFDTLPFRKGHDDWLEEAISYLDREDVFAIGGSFNRASKHHDAWDGWYFSHKCSLNFSLMKRSNFMVAMDEFARDFIRSGFKEENPAEETNQGRFLVEVALERYIQKHDVYTLCKVEDDTWTIFHTNTHGICLKETRTRYLLREDIQRYMNAGLDEGKPIPGQGKYYGNFYGKPRISLIKQIRIWFGISPLGFFWHQFKKIFLSTNPGESKIL